MLSSGWSGSGSKVRPWHVGTEAISVPGLLVASAQRLLPPMNELTQQVITGVIVGVACFPSQGQ